VIDFDENDNIVDKKSELDEVEMELFSKKHGEKVYQELKKD
jgi:hypothetical protein